MTSRTSPPHPPGRSIRGIGAVLLLTALMVAFASPAAAAPRGHTTPVTISTVPAVSGFPVTLDGVTRRTDRAGKAHFAAPVIRKPLSDRIRLTPAVVSVGGQQVKAVPTRLYRFPTGPQLALNLSYLVGFTMSNAGGPPVEASSMKTIVVRSGTGEVTELPTQEPSWLQGRRAVPKRTGLVVKNVDWSVERVIAAGSNVVNQSQQRFRPGSQKSVDVTVLFFGLQVRVSDGLYGFHLSDTVTLKYPDGSSHTFPLDKNGEATIPALPRGDYVLTPLGAGLKVAHPVGISRKQTVDIQFYSWPDVVTVLGAFLALAGALAWIGTRRRRRHPARQGDDGPTEARQAEPPSPRASNGVTAHLEVAPDHSAG